MCLGIPGQIVDFDGEVADLAMVDVAGVRRRINVGLLDTEPLEIGDWVLIHVGFAMAKIDEEEAHSNLEFLKTLGPAFDDEMDAFSESGIR